MQIRLLGDLGTQWVDHHKPSAFTLRPAEAAHEVQIGDRRVIAPDDIELGVLGEFRRAPGDGAVSAGPPLAAHSAAQSAAIDDAGAELMKKAQ
jgi:hypothetical protein